MDTCLECLKPFKRVKPNQRFCAGGLCRTKYHNREKGSGLVLTPKLRDRIRALAAAHDVTENEMACRMMNQLLNPDGAPLADSDIYGKQEG